MELLVTAAQLDKPFVGLVTDEETAEREAADPLKLSRGSSRNPALGRYGKQRVEIAFPQGHFLASQDRDGDRDLGRRDCERAAQEQAKIDVAVVTATEKDVPRPPDVPLRIRSNRYSSSSSAGSAK